MKIATLLTREPFAGILESTLSRWLTSRFGASFHVRWRDSRRLEALPWRPDPRVWIVNPHLNLMVRSDAPTGAFTPPREEFRRAIGLARRIPQAAYAEAAGRRATAWLLAPFQVTIDPVPPASRGWIVMGGNLRLRIVDTGACRSWVIPKTGFDRRFHEADLHARRELGAPLAPRLLDVPEPPEWYAEALVTGLPLNRLASARERAAAVVAVTTALDAWTASTARPIELADHVERALAQVSAVAVPSKLTGAVAGAMDAIRRAAARARAPVSHGPTHGDFQPANVLSGVAGTWLIDWERQADRSVHYDSLVWTTGVRLSPKWTAALASWVAGSREWRAWSEMKPSQSWLSESERLAFAVAFLADELLFRVEEVAVAPSPGAQAEHARRIDAVRDSAATFAA